ncbi:hypothetical protein [Chryseobacterium sp. CT-SW4]|uniref:hypothetical protein n=1 Tax=Chryseobacterium sp. SW-1 TaxID=3157343 RepID=UPI003B01CB17
MNITEFISHYGMYVILVPVALTTILLIIGEMIKYKEGIPVSLSRIFAVIFMGLMGLTAIKIFTLPDNQQKPIKAFFKSIDWNFWGYYILFPCFLTILIISIINALRQKNEKNGFKKF